MELQQLQQEPLSTITEKIFSKLYSVCEIGLHIETIPSPHIGYQAIFSP